MDDLMDRFQRRLQAMPPGACPLAEQLALLVTSGAQTCGKCVPCRDGIPQMIALLDRIVKCEASQQDYDSLKALAQMVSATSDCAIGYEAADAVLRGMQDYSEEYESHLKRHACSPGSGQMVPCEQMCPAHVNAPAYIALVENGDYAGAVNMVRKDNPLPTACALVCEHPCELHCRRALIDSPVNIRGIKRYAVDNAHADNVPTPRPGVATGRRIAIVGGGPSGLTCAYFLALMGHSVVIYEKNPELGGMLRYAIPEYRFPHVRLLQDIRAILDAGDIKVLRNNPVDTEEMKELSKSFDAVFVSIGAQGGKNIDIENADAAGVVPAVYMLHEARNGAVPDYRGMKVVVIGGGNVAIDCARTAMRAGADEVAIVYRRRKQDMPALDSEIEEAIAEGVEMVTLESPVKIEIDERGHCIAIVIQPQMVGPIKAGRPVPLDANKPQRRLGADAILVAIGQSVETAPFEEFGMKVERGHFVCDERLCADGFENVFIGGDCKRGPAAVIAAVADGKNAAHSIDEFLGYHHKLGCDVEVPDAVPNDRTPTGRVEFVKRPAQYRKHDFDAIETGMTHEEALQECRRCLRCDKFGCGVLEGGSE